MALRVVAGTANRALATAIAAELHLDLARAEVERFPDGELRPAVAEVAGDDVFVVQPTGPPVNDNLVELLLLIDACQRAGADRITAVVPYLGYARQDRRGVAGQALGARVVADVLGVAGADRLVVVDPHPPALEAMCSMRVVTLTAAPVLVRALAGLLAADAVIVAPDLGAVKLAERYAKTLRRTVAVVRKTRVSGSAVSAHELVGDVVGRPVVIVDDMISTGATLEAAMRVVHDHGAADGVTIAASHGPLVRGAIERLDASHLRRVLVTDSLATAASPPLEVCSIAGLLADAINRLHHHLPIDDLLGHM